MVRSSILEPANERPWRQPRRPARRLTPSHHRTARRDLGYLRASWRPNCPGHPRTPSSAVTSVAPETMAVAAMMRSAGSDGKSLNSAAMMPMSPDKGTSPIPNSSTFRRQAATDCPKSRRRRLVSIATSQNVIAETSSPSSLLPWSASRRVSPPSLSTPSSSHTNTWVSSNRRFKTARPTRQPPERRCLP